MGTQALPFTWYAVPAACVSGTNCKEIKYRMIIVLLTTEIQERNDWYSITTTEFQKAGGSKLLAQYGSVSNVLMSVVPEYHDDQPLPYTLDTIGTPSDLDIVCLKDVFLKVTGRMFRISRTLCMK